MGDLVDGVDQVARVGGDAPELVARVVHVAEAHVDLLHGVGHTLCLGLSSASTRVMPCAVSAARAASRRISRAMTRNSAPLSPARTAEIAEFRARMLVCCAMLSIVLAMRAIWLLESPTVKTADSDSLACSALLWRRETTVRISEVRSSVRELS